MARVDGLSCPSPKKVCFNTYYWQLSQQDDDAQHFHFGATAEQAPSLLWHFHFSATRRGKPPRLVIPQRRAAFPFWRQRGISILAQRGEVCCFRCHLDMSRRGLTPPHRVVPISTWRGGYVPSSLCSHSNLDMMRQGKPPPRCMVPVCTRWGGYIPSLPCSRSNLNATRGLPLLVALFPSLATTIAAMLTTTPKPVYATTICDDTLCNLPQPDPPEHEKRAKSVLFCCLAHSLLALSHPSHAGQNEDRTRVRFFSGHCHCCCAAPCPNPDYATTTIRDDMNHRDKKCTESKGGAGEPENGVVPCMPAFFLNCSFHFTDSM